MGDLYGEGIVQAGTQICCGAGTASYLMTWLYGIVEDARDDCGEGRKTGDFSPIGASEYVSNAEVSSGAGTGGN